MQNPNSLYDDQGHRLYLTPEERAAFVVEARKLEPHQRTFCTVLHDTGCRISEALSLPYGRVDLTARRVVLETLKKRRTGVFRGVPMPDDTLDLLDVVHGVRLAGKGKHHPTPSDRLWTFSRPTAWRIVKGVMQRAGIELNQSTHLDLLKFEETDYPIFSCSGGDISGAAAPAPYLMLSNDPSPCSAGMIFALWAKHTYKSTQLRTSEVIR